MDDLQSEKEQLEEIRAWWGEYGRWIIAGAVITVGLVFGFNQYQSSKVEAELEASVLFEKLLDHVDGGEVDAARTVAGELATDYANTSYAAQSRLAMARLYMDRNRDQDAADELSELIGMRGNREVRAIGRARLARVLLYQEKPDAVVELLTDVDEPAFAARYAESLGDAHAALGDVDQAAEAYQVALLDASQSVDRALVQMKLAGLPDVAADEAPAAEEDTAAGAAPAGESPAADTADDGDAAAASTGDEG